MSEVDLLDFGLVAAGFAAAGYIGIRTYATVVHSKLRKRMISDRFYVDRNSVLPGSLHSETSDDSFREIKEVYGSRRARLAANRFFGSISDRDLFVRARRDILESVDGYFSKKEKAD